jgi:hypothetical protein
MTVHDRLQRFAAVLVAGAVVVAMSHAAVAQQKAPAGPKRFATPEEATDALVGALRANSPRAILGVLGPEARPLVSSMDSTGDQAKIEKFLGEFDAAHRIEKVGENKAVVYVGKDDWPLPIPIVQSKGTWQFDTKAGKEEILNRRIGENELSVIQVCLAYVDAQREYYRQPRDRSGVLQYAQKIRSTPGLKDGLYWDAAADEPQSPLGPLAAQAAREGYKRRGAGAGPAPYHGYYFRILTAQGADAPGGAYDYIARGHMIGGFALVAFPAEYGVSGVMTFIVNHDGVVYQKDLGPRTLTLGREMKRFNPDRTWTKVDDTALAGHAVLGSRTR